MPQFLYFLMPVQPIVSGEATLTSNDYTCRYIVGIKSFLHISVTSLYAILPLSRQGLCSACSSGMLLFLGIIDTWGKNHIPYNCLGRTSHLVLQTNYWSGNYEVLDIQIDVSKLVEKVTITGVSENMAIVAKFETELPTYYRS